MAFSRYYGAQTANGSGVLGHTINNPDNASFGFLNVSHIELRLSSAGQSLVAFKAALEAGMAKLTIYNDYTLESGVITLPASYGLTQGATYQLQIKRATPKLAHYVNFNAGAPITETDLDNSNSYALFRAQEIEDDLGENLLTLINMKNVSGITGDFVDTLSVQTVRNKTFPADQSNVADYGLASWTNQNP